MPAQASHPSGAPAGGMVTQAREATQIPQPTRPAASIVGSSEHPKMPTALLIRRGHLAKHHSEVPRLASVASSKIIRDAGADQSYHLLAISPSSYAAEPQDTGSPFIFPLPPSLPVSAALVPKCLCVRAQNYAPLLGA